jgi:hypothetical protein
MSNVYRLRARKMPLDTRACLERLLADVDTRPLVGIAFVAYVDDSGFIADACGKAREQPGHTREMLRALDNKLARLERG